MLPTPGAVGTVKGFATGEFDGYYGSDVALKEFATDTGRFKGFKAHVKRMPVQSLWSYTLDVGLAIKAERPRQDQVVGRPQRQAGLHRARAVRHAQASRKRDGTRIGVKHVYKRGRSDDRRLAAQERHASRP